MFPSKLWRMKHPSSGGVLHFVDVQLLCSALRAVVLDSWMLKIWCLQVLWNLQVVLCLG